MANKSKTYLLPYMVEFIDLKFINKIVNTYIFYNREYTFCIEYEFSGKKDFVDYEADLMANEYFIESLDTSDTQVLYVFELPAEMYPVIELFIDGKYSYLPYKERIKEFLITHFGIDSSHRIMHILDRSEELRVMLENDLGIKLPPELDLAEKPDLLTEEFNMNNHE